MNFTTDHWVTAPFPYQILLIAMMLWWTEKTEDTLRRTTRKNKKILNKTLAEFENRFKEIVRLAGELDRNEKLRSLHLEVCITLFLHNLDIFRQLVQANISNPRHFDWQKQMRYYWRFDGRKCIVSITDVDREYSYEYLGCTTRLVITPLTDRYYITLAQALVLCMGEALAGTGKIETVKDMAKALGIMCVVFNCSDQMNFQALGRIFRGLAQSGCWGTLMNSIGLI
jgi:dynein heavy chain